MFTYIPWSKLQLKFFLLNCLPVSPETHQPEQTEGRRGRPTGEPAGPDDGEPREQERLQHVNRRLRARGGHDSRVKNTHRLALSLRDGSIYDVHRAISF